MPVTIDKASVTITTSYAAAPPSVPAPINSESWGCITLWDIRPWLPWVSRGLVGALAWEDYLGRTTVMGSTLAPNYNPATQGPKSWVKQTNTVDIIDITAPNAPYTLVSIIGPAPYTYQLIPSDQAAAFDLTTVQTLCDTLVLAIYAYNSVPPIFGGPTGTDNLRLYGGIYLDVFLSDGTQKRYRPQSTEVIAPGVNVGNPTTVVGANNAVSLNPASFADVQETNGGRLVGALWHPALLLVEDWVSAPTPVSQVPGECCCCCTPIRETGIIVSGGM